MPSTAPLPSPSAVLEAVTGAFSEYIAEEDIHVVSELLLARILELTSSEYGFIGRVERSPTGQPQLRTTALTNIAWSDETRTMVEQAGRDGLVFTNLNTLFGRVLATETLVISNAPGADPRAGGLPPGHPPLNAFMGVPLKYRREMVGMVGVANRPSGYSQELSDALRPFFLVCGNIIEGWAASEARRAIEADLRLSEARHRLVLESAHEAVVTTDEHGVIQGVNASTQSIFGYSSDELVGQPMTRLLPFGALQPDGTGRPRELPARRRDGTEFPAELSLGEGTVNGTRLFTSILRDITLRVRAEDRLRDTLREMERARGHLDQLLDDLSVGCVLLDAQGHTEFVSKSCAWMLSATALAEDTHWRDWMPLDRAVRVRFEALLEVPAPGEQIERVTFDTPEGTRRHFRVQVLADPRQADRRMVYFYETTETVELYDRIDAAQQHAIVGHSPPIRAMRGAIQQVARGDWNVLIEGETGTGKELVARAIHEVSPRAGGPFLAINCAVLTPNLVASTLFGHRRGAFTGADRDQAGVIEAAQGGTLLLDEVGDLALDVQAALLRVVQEREIRRVGETRVRKVDVRILFATHRDLAAQVAEGRFRSDLFYRIRVARLEVPPLRDRGGDVRLLAATFAQRRRPGCRMSPAALDALEGHHWPGNVRELLAVVEHALIYGDGDRIELRHLPPELRPHQGRQAGPLSRQAPKDLSRSDVEAALREAGGNRSRAARQLGISRASLYRVLGALGL